MKQVDWVFDRLKRLPAWQIGALWGIVSLILSYVLPRLVPELLYATRTTVMCTGLGGCASVDIVGWFWMLILLPNTLAYLGLLSGLWLLHELTIISVGTFFIYVMRILLSQYNLELIIAAITLSVFLGAVLGYVLDYVFTRKKIKLTWWKLVVAAIIGLLFYGIISITFFGESETTVRQRLCENTGGTISTASCCGLGGGFITNNYPNTCAIGACGCAPEYSTNTLTCNCPEGKCYMPETGCITPLPLTQPNF